jgi:tetratricopeptide (TPR) repeat protein
MPTVRRALIMVAMPEDLDARLRRLRASVDAGALIDLGCDLAAAGRHRDAEWCFRRATGLGSAADAFQVANELAARRRWGGASTAYEVALAGGDPGAWRALGAALESQGDVAAALDAYRGAAQAGDPQAAAIVACRLWCTSLDPALEADLRAGADLLPAARADLGDLLRSTGRSAEARRVLERGAKLGEAVCWLPLGNLYADDLGDVEAAEEAYRAGITAGDSFCHHNLGVLLADRGDLEGALEQFRRGAALGDELAAEALRDLGAA